VSRAERRLRGWLLATGAMYALGAVDFLARPRAAAASLSGFGERIEPEDPPGLFNSLASAYMATIAALSLGAAAAPDEHRELIPPLLVAKATSSAALLYRYERTRKLGFAVAAALDALLFGVTAGLSAAADR
jgi:hypothetical protein